jgi:GT2 family glycosyltransferase
MQRDCLDEKSIHKISSDQYTMASLIISNYNGEKHLHECLSSLMQLDYPLFEVIVVDAESSDDSIMIIERDFPKVRLIKKGKIGIGEALNCGISVARGEFIVFDLNNDDVVDKKWLTQLVKVLANSPDIGAVVGKRFKYGSNNILDSAGGCISFLTGDAPPIGHKMLDSAVYNVQKEVGYAPVVATKKEILKKVGLLDPAYYIYYEDSDFGLRVTRSGYKIVFVPSAVFWHKGSSTVGQNSPIGSYYYHRNRLRFILKNYPVHFMISALFYSLIVQTFRDLPVLVPPIGGTMAKLSPYFKECAWGKNDLRLLNSRTAALLWNIKNLKNTIMARYQTIQ